jgi:hypothetical protein
VPDALLVQVADDVTTALNEAAEGTFSREFSAERSYADWELPLEDSGSTDDRVLVDVTPVPPLPTELLTRGHIAYEPAVDVIIRVHLGPERRQANGKFELRELDELVLFTQQIAEFFTVGTLTCGARWKETEIRRAFVPKHLHDNHQFTSIVRVTFDIDNAI